MDGLDTVIGPVVEDLGLELVDATFRKEGGRRVLRVTVDRAGGVDIDTIALASQQVSRRLDVEDFGGGAYTLEVSSPGVERSLRSPDDFVARVGETLKVKTYEPVEGAKNHTGELLTADRDRIRLRTEAGERELRHEQIASARTVFEWGSG